MPSLGQQQDVDGVVPTFLKQTIEFAPSDRTFKQPRVSYVKDESGSRRSQHGRALRHFSQRSNSIYLLIGPADNHWNPVTGLMRFVYCSSSRTYNAACE
jgi:hypothetical protein